MLTKQFTCRLCAAAVSLVLGRIGQWSGREIARSALSLARSAQAERDNESCFFILITCRGITTIFSIHIEGVDDLRCPSAGRGLPMTVVTNAMTSFRTDEASSPSLGVVLCKFANDRGCVKWITGWSVIRSASYMVGHIAPSGCGAVPTR
ncbi:hypothetical protein EVAR_11242_1 [Eumeta japonica]|uniref:Secreted protein n=1 Tax=Eumeta variegata TaxID=151549 RepID=A0A4C1UL07_EUMVA|nr:hypothetical protein EVAR_11242_1 [Eumeta japonica]